MPYFCSIKPMIFMPVHIVYTLATVLPFTVCLVWTVILLLQYREAPADKRILFYFGVTATLLYFCHFLHFNGVQSAFSESLYYLCNLSVYPLYSIYVRRLTRPKVRPYLEEGLFFLPAIVVFLQSIIGKPGVAHTHLIAQWAFPIVCILSSAEALRRLLLFRRDVDNYYSNPGEKHLNPVMALIILLQITMLASFCASLTGRDTFLNSGILWIPSLTFSVLLFSIFYVGSRTVSPAYEMTEPEARETNQMEEQQNQLMEKIEAQMLQHELFRTKGLTVSDLASTVGSNRTYVSSCINQCRKMSFSLYVNGYRIRYAQQLMLEKKDLTFTEIAEEAGFVDRSSFYRSFKQETGMNPSTWLESR